MAKPIAITAVSASPDEDRHRRIVTYTVMMSIRVACVVAILFVPGWWRLVCLAGAVVLPQIAVVIANVSRRREEPAAEAPGPLAIPDRVPPEWLKE